MFKSFIKLLSVAAFTSPVLAELVQIAEPAANSKVVAGSNIIVKIDKPMTLSASEDVAVVIAIAACSPHCPDVTQFLGEILYRGPYSPVFYPNAWNPYQNFTVTIPSSYSGTVQLGVAHFYLVGAGLTGELQFTSTKVDVVG